LKEHLLIIAAMLCRVTKRCARYSRLLCL